MKIVTLQPDSKRAGSKIGLAKQLFVMLSLQSTGGTSPNNGCHQGLMQHFCWCCFETRKSKHIQMCQFAPRPSSPQQFPWIALIESHKIQKWQWKKIKINIILYKFQKCALKNKIFCPDAWYISMVSHLSGVVFMFLQIQCTSVWRDATLQLPLTYWNAHALKKYVFTCMYKCKPTRAIYVYITIYIVYSI